MNLEEFYDNQYDYFLLSSYKAHEPLESSFDVCLAKQSSY
jgi:hypothetical protein